MIVVVVVVAILVVHNIVGNLVLPAAVYVAVNLAVAAALVAIARTSGVPWADLGLSRSSAGRGFAFGAGAFVLIATTLAVAALVPATRPLFSDQRVAGVTGSAVAYQALFRIPLGTVVLEEIAFRSVLLALFDRVVPTVAAVMWSSAVFGLWHVIPTIEALRTNRFAPGPPAVAAAVAGTAVAGAVFCWLRLRSGSVIAPAMAHVATNSVALVLAVWVLGNEPSAAR